MANQKAKAIMRAHVLRVAFFEGLA